MKTTLRVGVPCVFQNTRNPWYVSFPERLAKCEDSEEVDIFRDFMP